jgi:uncharacterized repeat protein (TIGR03803 family)
MSSRSWCAMLIAFAASSAFAANPQAVAVHTFACPGNCPNGAIPKSLVQGSNGNFYGVAQQSTSNIPDEGGVVFSLTPAGAYNVLYKFVLGKADVNGSNPAVIVEGADGKLYGVTSFGGADNYGTVFRLNRNGSGFQTLHSFCGFACGDIATFEPLVVAGDGNVYGSQYNGGDVSCGYAGPCGAIFRITASTGAYEIVVNFSFATTGANPTNLVVGPDGTLYGTSEGEDGPQLFHYDEVAGTIETSPLALPSGITDSTASSLVLGPNGNLYGMYTFCNENGGEVTGLFEVQLNGSDLDVFPAIADFPLASSDGFVVGSDGNLWMAQYQAQSGWGDILTISPEEGTLIGIFSPFSESSAVGGYPFDLISARDGKLWGVSSLFGQVPKGKGAGVVFKVTP